MSTAPFHTAPKPGPMMNEAFLAKLRIASGLILFAYILLHFLNHAAGLISLDAMRGMGWVMKTVWRFPPMTVLLYGALAVHFGAALLRIYSRRSLRMGVSDWAQIVLGIAIPFLLVVHVMGTRYAAARYGVNDTYSYVLLSTFVFSPAFAWFNSAGLLAAWLHSCIGLHMWMRVKERHRQWHYEAGLVLAAIIPTASLAGYWATGRQLADLSTDGEFMGQYYERLNVSNEAVWGMLEQDTDVARLIIIGLLAVVIAARIIRSVLTSRTKEIEIDFSDGTKIRQPVGASLLEMSQLSNVPHAMVCGGRGRCSTCRVRILNADADFPAASEAEQKVLTRIKASQDVRLACQLHPNTNMKVVRLLPYDSTVNSLSSISNLSSGREKEITIMFADLRDFTSTAESRLPYDVVYLINQFSEAMGKEVEACGGRIDKFLGDGFMALFGLETTAEQGAKDALRACAALVEALEQLNNRLRSELDHDLRMGVGVHTGTVVLGDMGYGAARSLTALGDAVNTASRLEQETKKLKTMLCISEKTLTLAELSASKSTRKLVSVRGKSQKVAIHALNTVDGLQTPEGALN